MNSLRVMTGVISLCTEGLKIRNQVLKIELQEWVPK